jgi:Domain of unknown function (DUF1992)
MLNRSSLLIQRATKTLSRRAFSRREAPLPALNNPVENAIAAAQQRGDLNNLSGSGKPLKQGVEASRVPTGMTSSELLSKKAEFEMRRAMHNKELDHLQGQKLVYKGTNIVPTSLGGGGDAGGEASNVMKRYIIDQAQPTVKDLKS